MRRIIKKWGEAALAAACVAAILFAALYTRQDDLKRLAARDAGVSQDQRLTDVQQPSQWQRPVDAAPLAPYIGAQRQPSGLWQLSPFVQYPVPPGQPVRAMAAGEVLEAADGCLRLVHGEGVETRYAGLTLLYVQPGDTVAAGQPLGAARETVQISALRDGAHIDPESLLGQ